MSRYVQNSREQRFRLAGEMLCEGTGYVEISGRIVIGPYLQKYFCGLF